MATRLDMAQRVLHMIGNDSAKLDLCKSWVDDSYAEVQHYRPFRITQQSTTFPTVATQANYSLPNNFFAVRTVRDTTSGKKRLSQIDYQQYDDLNTAAQGPPRYYTLNEGELWVYPTPDAIYTIRFRYWKNLPVLADGDNHLLDAPWTEVIVLGAAARGMDYYNEHERAEAVRRMQRNVVARIESPESLDLFDRDVKTGTLEGGM